MTATTRTPENTGYLQASKFLLTFDRIPNVQYFCQTVNLPGVSIGQATINTPTLDVFSPGNKLTYDKLNVTFIVDESMVTWQELYKWFRSMGSPEGVTEKNYLSAMQNQFASKDKKYYSDATLTILSALNNPITNIRFINLFPVSLSDIQFDTQSSADSIITATATFHYQQFDFAPI
jgi:hypothetical protein